MPGDTTHLVSDLRYCTRCDVSHTNLKFKKFKYLPTINNWTHWATCPSTKKIILLTFDT